MTSIEIPNSVTSIGGYAFYGCTGLTSVTIPDSVTAIGDGAFFGCTGLTTVTIPESVTSIGVSAFYGCTGLTTVAIPESVTSIDVGAFSGCTGLTSVNFNATNCSSMGTSSFPVFSGCTALATLNIGENVTKIPGSAFYGCTALTSATFPQSGIDIGNGAFYNCSNLVPTNAIVANNIGDEAFYSCSNLASFDFSTVRSIGTSAFYKTGLKEVSISSTVETIGNDAFGSCLSLKIFSIEDSSSPIELDNSIVGGSPIEDLYIGRDYEGSAFNANGMKTLTIGNLVTNLPEGAFQNSTSLEAVAFGSGLKAISANAFKGCSKLGDIVVPRNVVTIGANAFDGCSAVSNIAIGCGTTSIGELAFNNVNAAQSVCVAALTPPSANNNSFSNYNVPLYVPAESHDDYYNYPRCWYRFEPEPLKVISNVTINGNGSIANVEVGNTIKLEASFEPADATLPYIFWRSSNPTVAIVDNDGNVVIPRISENAAENAAAMYADSADECEIIAETMYADGPIATFKIKVDNSGIEDVVVDKPEITRPRDIYTLQGICVKRNATDEDVRSLSPGFYIIAGKKVLVK